MGFNPLISPENLWRHQGGGTRRGRSGPALWQAAQMLGCIRIWFQKTVSSKGISRRNARGLPALARFSLSVSGGKHPVAIHATARSAASSLSLARRCGFDENTNQSDKGMIATSNAAPATNAADGDPQRSCKRPAASGPTAINT